MELSSLSRQYVPVVITIRDGDPTSSPVSMAFTINEADPVDADWQAASWSDQSGPLPGDYVALCLIGPGGTIALPKGEYSIFAKVTSNPEVPVIPCGMLTLT
jgi:hypothetical protein